MSFPVTRPNGRALIVGSPGCRQAPHDTLQRLGFQCAEMDDPYSAMMELCRRPLVYRALILSLQSLYREELQMIASVKRRFPHVEIWLSQTDGRQAALAEAMRYGADGLIAEDGLHRTAIGAPPNETTAAVASPASSPPAPSAPDPADAAPTEEEVPFGEPVLTAEELRALLQEQPSLPHSGEEE